MNDTRNIVKSQATLRNSTQLFATFIRFFQKKIENIFRFQRRAARWNCGFAQNFFAYVSMDFAECGRAQSGLTASAVAVPDCEGHASFKRANHRLPGAGELPQ
ncbi:MAG: hypothetical protein LUG15_06650 [Oscillospiraceae bacterium]|nr:hypothetical protein [Oscillospiraceae bacterium]